MDVLDVGARCTEVPLDRCEFLETLFKYLETGGIVTATPEKCAFEATIPQNARGSRWSKAAINQVLWQIERSGSEAVAADMSALPEVRALGTREHRLEFLAQCNTFNCAALITGTVGADNQHGFGKLR